MKAATLTFGLVLAVLLASCTHVRTKTDTPSVYYAKETTGSVCRADCSFGERQSLLEISYDKRRESLLAVSACEEGTLRLSLFTTQSLALMNILYKDGIVDKKQFVPGHLPFSPAQIVNDCLLCSASDTSIREALPAGWNLAHREGGLDLTDVNGNARVRITRQPGSCLIENTSFRYTVLSTVLDGGNP